MKTKVAKQDAPDPEEDELHSEFMDRCISEMTSDDENLDESDAEEACQIAWEESRAADSIIHKTHASEVKGMSFVLSDSSVDRMGDIIMANGWKLSNFKRNPIALGFHRNDFIVGRWKDVRVEGTELRGDLELAPEGTSPRIDEIRRLVDAGILRAVSVGFRPLKHEPLDPEEPWNGARFLEQELVECSLVSVPANANAIAVAKSLQISPETMDVVFAKHGKRGAIQRRGFTGKHANTQRRTERGSVMSTLNQRISDVQVAIAAKTAALEELIAKMDDSDVSDAEYEANTKLRAELAKLEKTREMLMESEKHLASRDRKRERQHHHQWRRLAQSRIEHDRAAASRGERPRCADHPSQWSQKGLRAARSARARWHRRHPREGVGRLDGSRADENLRRRCRRPRKPARSSCAPRLRQR